MAEDDELEWEEWDPSRITWRHHVIAGSCAGLAEHVCMFPMDTLKTQLQCERCGSVNPMTTWNCAQRIVRNEGIFRLWRGVSAMFAGCVPAHALYFSIYESMKKATGMDKEGHQVVPAAMCGATAALGHDMVMTPFDTVKQRMQLGYYNTTSHCARTIIKTEGVRALYVSLPTTLAMNLPYGMIMVAVNESMRKVISPGEGRLSVASSMISGSIAGAIAAALTNPLDIVKTRLQTQNLEPCPKVVRVSTNNKLNTQVRGLASASAAGTVPAGATGVGGIGGVGGIATEEPAMLRGGNRQVNGSFQAMSQILKEEGPRGFFRGMTPRILLHAPAVAVSWTTYEFVKNLLAETKIV